MDQEGCSIKANITCCVYTRELSNLVVDVVVVDDGL